MTLQTSFWTSMGRIGRGLALISLLLALSAPGCSRAPQKYYYTINYVLPPTTKAPARFKTSLRMKPLDVGRPYDTRNIVFRLSPFEIHYYQHRLWATKPQKMLTDILLKRLERAHLFEDLSLQYKDRLPDYELVGELDAIEKVDSEDLWFAHLVISFDLVSNPGKPNAAVVWQYAADKRKQIYDPNMVVVVRTISELFEEVLKEVQDGVAAYLERVGRERSASKEEP